MNFVVVYPWEGEPYINVSMKTRSWRRQKVGVVSALSDRARLGFSLRSREKGHGDGWQLEEVPEGGGYMVNVCMDGGRAYSYFIII